VALCIMTKDINSEQILKILLQLKFVFNNVMVLICRCAGFVQRPQTHTGENYTRYCGFVRRIRVLQKNYASIIWGLIKESTLNFASTDIIVLFLYKELYNIMLIVKTKMCKCDHFFC
jgi:hypothetical protein